MKYNHSPKSFTGANAGISALVLFFLMIFMVSCQEDPSYLGRNILPPGDSFLVNSSFETDITAYTSEAIPEGTTYRSVFLLGSMNDDIFGEYKADFLTQFQLASTSSIGNDRTLDSLVLNLKMNSYFGDTLSVQTIRIYEMTDTLSYDSLYYSDFDPTGLYDINEVGSTSFTSKDSVISIPIVDTDLLSRFETVDDTIFSNSDNFLNFFKGLYVTTDLVANGGGISFIDISSDETELNMYYRSPEDTSSNLLNLKIYQRIPKVNMFSHDYTGTRINEQLNNVSSTDTLMFISGLSTAVTHLSFPGLESWLDSSNIVINQAQLTLSVEDTLLTNLNKESYPSRLFLYSDYTKGSYQLIYDYLVDSDAKSYYGGNFNESEQVYSFNIGVHLQSYLTGIIESMDMTIVPSTNDRNLKQLILKGPLAETNKMRLKIVYTKID